MQINKAEAEAAKQAAIEKFQQKKAEKRASSQELNAVADEAVDMLAKASHEEEAEQVTP